MTEQFDGGGLDYTIAVDYSSSPAVNLFIKDLNAAQTAFAEFKANISSLSAGTIDTVNALKEIAKASDVVVTATRKAARASDERSESQKREDAALALVEKRLERRAILERANAIEAARAQASSAKQTDVEKRKSEALASLEKLEQRLALARERSQLAFERGVNIGARAASGLTAEQVAQNKLADAIERQAEKQALANLANEEGFSVDGKKLTILTERQKLEALLSAAVERQAEAEKLRAFAAEQGLTADGKKNVVLTEREQLEARLDAAIAKQVQQESLLALATERGFTVDGKKLEKLTERQALEAKLSELIKSRVAAETFENFAKNKGFDTSGNELEKLTDRQRAEAKLGELQRKRAQEALLQQVADERGLEIDGRKKVVLTEEDKLKRRLLEANNALSRARQQSADTDVRAINVETEALNRQIKADQELAIADKLRQSGRQSTGAPLVPELSQFEQAQQKFQKELNDLQIKTHQDKLRSTSAEYQRLKKAQDDASDSGNRVGFTYRRLIGIFATFTVVRTVVQAFKDLVRESIQFNANLESNATGIASLILAEGQIADAQGEVSTTGRQFALAVGIAKEQLALLRREGLLANASVQQLAETFQTALAPGLTAGLNIDQVRKFTVQISQAATAIALPQNQLAEEIRSLLSGTIQARTTRIATALGITNENVRQAKELGVLAQFLETRFKSFNTAAIEAQNNFNTLLNRAKNGIQALVGEGALPFFNELKALLKDVGDQLIRITDNGTIEINPKAKEVVRLISDSLRSAVVEGRKLLNTLSFEDAVKTVRLLSTIAVTTVGLIVAVLRGTGQALIDLTNIANTIKAVIEPIANLFGGTTSDLISTIVRVFIVYKSIAATLLTITSITKVWGIAMDAISLKTLLTNASLNLTKKGLDGASQSALSLQGFLRGAAAAAGLFLINITLLQAEFQHSHDVALGFFETLELGWIRSKASAQAFFIFFSIGITTIVVGAAKLIVQFFNQVTDLQLAAAEQGVKLAESFLPKAASEKIRATFEGIKAVIKGTQNSVIESIDGLIDRVSNNGRARIVSIVEAMNAAEAELAAKARESDSSINTGAATEAPKVLSLSAAFDQLSGTINKTQDGLEHTKTSVKDLREELLRAREEQQFVLNSIGLSGQALLQAKAQAEAQSRIRREGKELVASTIQAEKQLAGIKAEQLSLGRQINDLPANQSSAVAQGVAKGRQILSLNNQLAESKSKLALLQARRDAALQKNQTKEADNIQGLVAAESERNSAIRSSISAIRQQADALLAGFKPDVQQTLIDLITKRISLAGDEKVSQEQIAKILGDRSKLEGIINATASSRVAEIAASELRGTRDRIAEVEREIDAQQRLQRARKTTSPVDDVSATSKNQLIAEKAKLALLQEELSANEEALTNILDQTTGLANQLIVLAQIGLVRAVDAKLIAAQKGVIDDITLAIQKQKEAVAAASAQKAVDLGISIQLLRAQVDGEKDLAAARRTTNNSRDDDLAAASAELLEQRTKLLVLQEQNALSLKRLAVELQFAPTLEDEVRLLRELGLLQTQSALQTKAQQQAIAEANRKLEEQRKIAEHPVAFGIQTAFDNFFKTASDKFQQTIDVVTAGLNGIAQIGGEAFASIFDPNSNFSIRERLGQLALEIAQTLATNTIASGIASILPSAAPAAAAAVPLEAAGVTLITAGTTLAGAALPLGASAATLLAAANALIVANSIGFGFAHGGPVPGFARGGPVQRSGRPSIAHYTRPQGFSIGGRPRGIDPRDTVAAWLRPGEYVIRPEIVSQAPRFVAALNDGAFDPDLLRAWSQGFAPRAPKGPSLSFAKGGPVQTVRASARDRSSRQDNRPVPAYIIPDAQTADSILSAPGANDVFLKKIRMNATEINAMLDRRS